LGDFIFLDFETPYSTADKFSLEKMTYEQYIRDERFFVHGMGYKVNDQEVQYVSGDQDTSAALSQLFPPGNDNVLVAHRTHFDGAVLSWYYKRQAAKYYCTESMSRAVWGQESAALAAVAERCFPDDETKRKGKELADFDGILRPLTDEEQVIMGGYCKNDVSLTFDIFAQMYKWLPQVAFDVMNISLSGFIHPGFVLDRQRVEDYLEQVLEEKNEAVKASGLPEEVLASNDKFAAWILEQGIPYEKVPSPTPKDPENTKWPLAKDAPEFLAIQADYPEHQAVFNARLLVKSTIERSRAQRLLDHAEISRINPEGKIALPLAFCAAHTKRFGGTNKINPQNFKRGSELRRALCAPKGYLVGVADSSNIEARVLPYLAGCNRILNAFAAGEDLYAQFAERVYKKPVTKEDIERFVGKVCILGLGFGMAAKTLRLTLAKGALGGPRLFFSMQECIELVYGYRSMYEEIPLFWNFLDRMLLGMCQKGFRYEYKGLIFEYQRVTLPNGMVMNYPDLSGDPEGEGKWNFTYWNGKFYTKIYGGKFAENLTQAVAQAILWEQMVESDNYLRTVDGRIILQVHDEIISLSPNEVAEEALERVLYIMRIAPDWCTEELVLDAEGGLDTNYSK
jgi:DNA polymerase